MLQKLSIKTFEKKKKVLRLLTTQINSHPQQLAVNLQQPSSFTQAWNRLWTKYMAQSTNTSKVKHVNYTKQKIANIEKIKIKIKKRLA